jgi:Double zinc ribbon
MSQNRGPADPADDRGTGIGPAALSPGNEGAIAGGPPVSPPGEQDTLTDASAAEAPTTAACARCGQPVEADSRFCPACGERISTVAAETARAERQEQRLRRWSPVIILLWLVLMIAAFVFIYSHAFVVGST